LARPLLAALPRPAGNWSSRVVARKERLDALCAELAAKTEVHGLVLDVRDRKAMEQAIANLPAGFDKLRGLVNNAGLALGVDAAQNCSLDDWETMVDTNIKAWTTGKPWSIPTSRG